MKRARSCHAKAVQSAAVAAGVLAGQSTSQIAAELGVTTRRVRQLLEADETRQIITAVVNDRIDVIVELFERSLEVIRRAMNAKLRSKDGTIIGPDHYARLAAVSKLIQILTAGRPIPKPREPKREGAEGIIDYEQLCKIVEANKAARATRAGVAKIPRRRAGAAEPREGLTAASVFRFCLHEKRKLWEI